MSQLPKYGGQGSKNVRTTTSKTSRIPGTNTTISQSKTVEADVTLYGTESEVNIRSGGHSSATRSGASGLRQPTGLRTPGGAQQPQGRPAACAPITCGAGPRTPARPTGLPQVLLQGVPRSNPTPGQQVAAQPTARTQVRSGGLQQPQATGLQRPSPSGLPQSTLTGLQRPTGMQRPTPTGMQRSMPTGMQRPASTGMQRPTPVQQRSSGQRISPADQAKQSGLQRLTPSGGPTRRISPQTQPKPRGLQPPVSRSGKRSATPTDRPSSCGGPCSAPPAQQTISVMVQPPTPARGARPPPIPLQTPVTVRPEMIVPDAPRRPTTRPTGPEAYRRFIFESKPKLKIPTAPRLTPSPGERRKRRAASPEERAGRSLLDKSQANLGAKVTARAASVSPATPQYIDTPDGKERILKQTVLEKRVERDEAGEKIVKSLQIFDGEAEGTPKKIEMNLQQLDPKYALPEGKEIISITSKVSMSESYSTVTQQMSRAITEPVAEAADMPPEKIAQLVEEENEDVDNTLKMLPPDLVLSPGRYEIKKRLQHLQLNSESVALLEQSITRPKPRADEAQAEPTPEVMAAMMHTVEKGVPPQSTPDQVFNTLFVETSNERYIKLSPVTQGPLQDVVVPTEVPYDVHKEVITDEMEKLTEKLQNIPTAAELPVLDIFDQVMAQDKKSPSKGKNRDISFRPISDEKSLWVNANLEHLVNVVGATPVEVLDPANVEELENAGILEQQMSAGVEYFVDADPIQYMSRVQLRGTQLPSYFPGYLVALPEFPDVVKLAASPDEVFSSAWKAVQPKYFPDESMQSLIF